MLLRRQRGRGLARLWVAIAALLVTGTIWVWSSSSVIGTYRVQVCARLANSCFYSEFKLRMAK
jgi:hypothetical protein